MEVADCSQIISTINKVEERFNMSSFNPIEYLYFNPELQAYSNVVSIEQAQIYYNTSNDASNLIYDTTVIPINLDPFVLLATNKDILPISYLSHTIRQAMSNEGLDKADIASKAKFATTIFQNMYYNSSNSNFNLIDTSFGFTINNLRVGDEVKVLDSIKREHIFTVSNLTPSNFTVNSHKYTLYNSSNYLLDGIKIVDPLRVAKISLIRNYASTVANQSNVLPESGAFNPTLYKTLYPDAALLSDRNAYIDYVSKRKNNVLRINNAEEILGNILTTSNVRITGVNNTINTDLTVGQSNRLVTEYGIRTYTENIINEIQSLGEFSDVVVTSNLNVQGPAYFAGQVEIASNLKVSNSFILTGGATLCNNLTVMKDAYFGSNLTVNNNALIYGALSVAQELNGPRFGIGYFMNSNNSNSTTPSNSPVLIADLNSNTYINGINVGIGIDTPTEKLHVVGTAKITSNLYVMNNVGIGLTTPVYQLHLSQDSAAKPASATWTVSSDQRLKTNIEIADVDRCYDIVKTLPLKHYTWRDEYLSPQDVADRNKLGWIAQEVEIVFPKAVQQVNLYGISNCRTLDADQIYAALYGCVQKLQTMVEDLQKQNQDLKEQVASFIDPAKTVK